MGLGPSIKMTTLHHYNCPITKRLINDDEIDFCGIIINGVSDNYDVKLDTAVQSAKSATELQIDGAIVAIDGWGNHHVDFVNVIEQLEMHGISIVGLSYIGQQGRLVCSSPYVSTIIDFNKSESGYESCIVGQNNVTEIDAYKAIEILKSKIKKNIHTNNTFANNIHIDKTECLERRYYNICDVKLCNEDSIENNIMKFNITRVEDIIKEAPEIADIRVGVINHREHYSFVNSNLDIEPICCKYEGKIGSGITNQLAGVTVMLTGIEEKTGYQPANIGSSEGILKQQMTFDQAGTPKSSDIILHIDVILKEGEGRTAEGIIAAHRCVDKILYPIRKSLSQIPKEKTLKNENYIHIRRKAKPKIALVKIVSALGNMYDTALYPLQPASLDGSFLLREQDNLSVIMKPLECLDGAIHSLI